MKWYEMDEEQRIKEVYSQYSIKKFWEWWSGGETKIMEVRIKDYPLIVKTSEKCKVPYSVSGVYVKNYIELKNVIAFVRDKTTVWFGINPRKRNWHPKTTFKTFAGLDTNVEEIGFILVDIDRKEKNGCASKKDLMECDMLADQILERLSKENWNKSYIKICSAHGVQLILKLDFPIKMPEVEFINKDKIFKYSQDFENNLALIREGIGDQIKTFTRKFKDINVELDKSVFNIGRVGALPVTKNFKYNTFKWRGIVDMKNEENVGLSDYVLQFEENIDEFKKKNLFAASRALLAKNRIRQGKLFEHPFTKFMLESNLPFGEINNKLWFQYKCLIRDSNIEVIDSDYIKFKRMMEVKLKGKLSPNLPNMKFLFNENIVNSFCINARFPPLYKLWPGRKKMDYGIETFDWECVELYDNIMKLKSDTTIQEDLYFCKEQLKEGYTMDNMEIVASFIKGLINKYGLEDTKYFHKYLFERGLGYK